MSYLNHELRARVQALERSFLLRAVWVFLLIALLLPWLHHFVWRWLLLDSTVGSGSLSLTGSWWAASFLLALYPCFWWLSLNKARTRPGCSSIPWALLGALPLFLSMEAVVRQPLVQNLLWSAVRVRAADDFFVRELSVMRLDIASMHKAAPRPHGLVFCGSSQLLHAIDTAQLETLLGGTVQVHRRAMAGFFPLEMCAAVEFIRVPGPQTYCFLFSGFDLGARSSLFEDAMRPVMTGRGFWNLWHVLNLKTKGPLWRSFIDLRMAATWELWRIRDYVRRILWHFFGAATSEAGQKPLLDQQKDAIEHMGENDVFLRASYRALNLLFEQLIQEGHRIVVFENRINPAQQTPMVEELNAQARLIFKAWTKDSRFSYVPTEEQSFVPEAKDWLDFTHLNAPARERFTKYVADYLQQEGKLIEFTSSSSVEKKGDP